MLIKRFEEQAGKTPDKLAVKTDRLSITYKELDAFANRVAQLIESNGSNPGDVGRVGLLFDDAIPMIAAVLGTLKTGNAYVPLSTGYPEKRLNHMIEHSGAAMILTTCRHMELGQKLVRGPEPAPTLVTVDEERDRAENFSAAPAGPQEDRLMYILYTSGSTGKPKGVMQRCQNILHFIDGYRENLGITGNDRMTLLSSFSHDAAVMDIYGSLLNGALLLPLDIKNTDFSSISRWLNRECVTIWHSVPTVYRYLVNEIQENEDFPALRFIVLGGEAVRHHDIDMFKRCFSSPRLSMYNLYGMTESTYNSGALITKDTPVDLLIIGKPLPGTKIFLADETGSIVKPLRTGEIIVASRHVSPGYWQDESATRACFRQHPEWGNLYRTGDMGRLLLDGSIEFAGRKDNQVKIRGFRVELEEIESQLLTHKDIKEAAVTIRETVDEEHYLCAYFVTGTPENIPDPMELRKYLVDLLPDYMIPTAFVQLEGFPLTSSGKVDGKALPAPGTGAGNQYTPPRNYLENQLVDIWTLVLAGGAFNDTSDQSPSPIGIDDNFFSLGGNSLKAVTLAAKINERLKVKVVLTEFFKHPTIKDLAAYIKNAAPGTIDYPLVRPDKKNLHHPFPLTDIQMTYLLGRSDQFEIGNVATHGYVEFTQQLDLERLNKSLNQVIKRHPMLRAIIREDGEQEILPGDLEYHIQVEDLSHLEPGEQKKRIQKQRKEKSHYVFKTDQWPLFAVKAFKLTNSGSTMHTYRLCIGQDRIIMDNLSSRIVQAEVAALYRDPELRLPALDFTFRDYMMAYKELENSQKYALDKDYWLDKLEDFPPAPPLPLKRSPAEITQPRFKRFNKIFNREEAAQLYRCAQMLKVTPSVLVCTAFAEVLAYWSNQTRFALNLTFFNRYPFHEDVNKVVGDFTSLILLEINLEPGTTFKQKCRGIQNNLFAAIEHRHYDGVRFIREIARRHHLGNKAVMPIVFTSLLTGDNPRQDNQNDDEKHIPGQRNDTGDQQRDDMYFSSQTSQAFIDNVVSDAGGSLVASWNFVEDLFHPETIETMFQQFVTRLINISGDKPDETVFQLPSADKVLIEEYNQTEAPGIQPVTLHQLFINQVKKTPDHIALVHGEEMLTYQELHEQSNRVARYIRQQGVGRSDLVGLLTTREINTMIRVMGVVKAGAAYVPIDPEYPGTRIDYILNNSDCKLFLEPGLPSTHQMNRIPAHECKNINQPGDLAYVIYTSGSTGKPKGVIITHQSAANTLIDINQRFDVNANDRVMAISSMCFDLSVYDVFGTLARGAAAVIIEDQRDIDHLADTLEKQQITIWNSVPSIMDLTVNKLLGEEGGVELIEEIDEVYYWSPVQYWQKDGDTIRIGAHSYSGAAPQVFPGLYFLTRKGVTLELLKEEFPGINLAAFNHLLEELIRNRVLVNSILSPREIFNPRNRLFYSESSKNRPTMDFHPTGAISFETVSRLLSIFRQRKGSDPHGTIRYFYASAGGLYPIDIYLHVKKGRVESLTEGLYYYNPVKHTIHPLPHGRENKKYPREIFKHSALSVYMVYNADVTMPKYGGLGYFMASIDAGIMAETMAQWSEFLDISVCPITHPDIDETGGYFHLDKSRVFIRAVAVGLKTEKKKNRSPGPALTLKIEKEGAFHTKKEGDTDNRELFYWSPLHHWSIEENRLLIGENPYPDVLVQLFPRFYFLAREGITRSQLEKEFPGVKPAHLQQFFAGLVQNRVLVNSLLPPHEIFHAQNQLFFNRYSKAILYVPREYEKYKKHQLTRAYEVTRGETIELPQTDASQIPAFIRDRFSHRVFDETGKISTETLSTLLSVFKENREDLENIDIYVYIKKNRLENPGQGLYLYDPGGHSLVLVNDGTRITEFAHFPGNRSIFRSSALSLFMITSAQSMKVGKGTGTGGWVEAGLGCGKVTAALTKTCELSGIGLCSIGSMNFREISKYFQLDPRQVFLHGIELGLKPGMKDWTSASASTSTALMSLESAGTPNDTGIEKKNTGLRLALLSGDWVPLTLPGKIKQYFTKAEVISLGGATEGSIWSIYYPIKEVRKEWKSIPYGFPLANQRFYVLNHELDYCPVDVAGELYIGGIGVAQGYMKDEKKTNHAFVHHPKLGSIYRTGDFGVLRRQGYIEFLGRKDNQVKIKGYRVELGEIQSCVLEHEAVKNAIVIDGTETTDKKYLCAYIVLAEGKEVPVSQLRAFLLEKLPPYMIPSYFIYLDEIPLTQNGKVDQKALPKPEENISAAKGVQYAPPGTDIEKAAAAICKEMFSLEQIGIHDNFFDLGAASVDILKLRNKLKETFHVDIPIIKMFEHSTLSSFSYYLSRLIANKKSPTVPKGTRTGAERPHTGRAAARVGVKDEAKDRLRQRIRKRSEVTKNV